MDTKDTGTFEEAWQAFVDAGYMYGEDALENVRFGWAIAHGLKPAKDIIATGFGADSSYNLKPTGMDTATAASFLCAAKSGSLDIS